MLITYCIILTNRYLSLLRVVYLTAIHSTYKWYLWISIFTKKHRLWTSYTHFTRNLRDLHAVYTQLTHVPIMRQGDSFKHRPQKAVKIEFLTPKIHMFTQKLHKPQHLATMGQHTLVPTRGKNNTNSLHRCPRRIWVWDLIFKTS